uniref:Uncharacterized protein n=1 Tax=Cacopsylla melanoneura TaxID=428564 RepID=A0A8D8YBS5_9HEMI
MTQIEISQIKTSQIEISQVKTARLVQMTTHIIAKEEGKGRTKLFHTVFSSRLLWSKLITRRIELNTIPGVARSHLYNSLLVQLVEDLELFEHQILETRIFL